MENQNHMVKFMRIENWSKINGITYKGFVIGSPSHASNYKIYNANVYNLNGGFKSNSSIWLIMEYDEDIKSFNVKMYDTVSNFEHTELLTLEKAKSIKGFREVYEAIIEQFLYEGIFTNTGIASSSGIAGSSNFNITIP